MYLLIKIMKINFQIFLNFRLFETTRTRGFQKSGLVKPELKLVNFFKKKN
jgi:hypothetical protein